MSEAAPAAEAPAGDGGAADGVIADNGATGTSSPEWMATLPDDLRADATLSRYGTLEDALRGHIETKKAFGAGRLSIPAADAAPEEWGKVWDALGRPGDVADYDVPVLDGMDPATTQPFRELAHGLGLNVAQAKGLTEFYNNILTDAQNQIATDSAANLQTLKDELGNDYAAKEAAASAAFKRIFGESAAPIADKLAETLGDANAVRGFMTLADMIGEHGRVDGASDPITGVPDAEAQKRIDTLMADQGWREKYKSGDATTVGEYQRLLAAATRHSAAQN